MYMYCTIHNTHNVHKVFNIFCIKHWNIKCITNIGDIKIQKFKLNQKLT